MNKAWTLALLAAIQTVSLPGRAGYEESVAERNLRLSGAYVSNTYGNGRNSNGDDMQNRALEVRFGQELRGTGLPSDSSVRIDFVHYNEGHPQNNHRDGFAGQIVFRKDISDRMKAEVGVGPYFSMNTTTVDGVELDDQRLGALATAAVLYYLGNNGWHVRAQYNRVQMPGAPSSDAVLVGVGKDFSASHFRDSADYAGDGSVWLDVMGGNTITNHGGTESAKNAAVELKKYYSNGMALSVSGIHEGDDGVRTDRNGVATQVWFVQPISEKWSMSAGVGPYFAINKRGSNNLQTNALISVRAERTVGDSKKGVKVFVDFSRVVSSDNNDRDMMRVGVQKRFK
ncbi:MAG: hypothetical protein JSU04_10540 [Bdellovibrionales bacterium]|nr:hypothetical protein [Bdellovibrionales bacterium]